MRPFTINRARLAGTPDVMEIFDVDLDRVAALNFYGPSVACIHWAEGGRLVVNVQRQEFDRLAYAWRHPDGDRGGAAEGIGGDQDRGGSAPSIPPSSGARDAETLAADGRRVVRLLGGRYNNRRVLVHEGTRVIVIPGPGEVRRDWIEHRYEIANNGRADHAFAFRETSHGPGDPLALDDDAELVELPREGVTG